MFGLVRRSRLLDAERRIVKLRVLLHKAADARRNAETALEVERRLREASHAEVERLLTIIEAGSVESEPAAPKPAAQEPVAEPRLLTGLEVVSRATRHRNIHNKAAERK